MVTASAAAAVHCMSSTAALPSRHQYLGGHHGNRTFHAALAGVAVGAGQTRKTFGQDLPAPRSSSSLSSNSTGVGSKRKMLLAVCRHGWLEAAMRIAASHPSRFPGQRSRGVDLEEATGNLVVAVWFGLQEAWLNLPSRHAPMRIRQQWGLLLLEPKSLPRFVILVCVSVSICRGNGKG